MNYLTYNFVPKCEELLTKTENNPLLFIGNGNYNLGLNIAKHLEKTVTLSDCKIQRFSDGEIKIPHIKEHIRNRDCIIIQSISKCYNNSVNDLLMELFILVDAIKRGGSKSITLALPCFPYQRQDRKNYSRSPISSKVIVNFIETLKIDRVICFDLHAEQIQGFFSDTLLDNLYTESYFVRYINNNYENDIKNNKFVIVSPDEGSLKRATKLSNRLRCPVVVIYKERNGNGEVARMVLMGDVKDKKCFVIDDMIDTGGTACKCAELLYNNGANYISMGVAHGILSGNAINRIVNSKFNKFVITNSLDTSEKISNSNDDNIINKFDIIDISDMCASAIQRSIIGKSVSELVLL